MPEVPVLLKVLLRQHHWQYAVFCAEYDKAAYRLDDDLTRTYPSRAQLRHRFGTMWQTISYEYAG